MSETEIAYCAGLLDGEGCLSVTPYPRGDGRQRYHCDIYLGMQNYSALEFFQQVVGTGAITRRHDIWMFQVSGVKAGRTVALLLPFLKVKREAAALFVEFAATFSSRNRKPVPDDIMVKRHELSQRIRHLSKADREGFRTSALVEHGVEED